MSEDVWSRHVGESKGRLTEFKAGLVDRTSFLQINIDRVESNRRMYELRVMLEQQVNSTMKRIESEGDASSKDPTTSEVAYAQLACTCTVHIKLLSPSVNPAETSGALLVLHTVRQFLTKEARSTVIW